MKGRTRLIHYEFFLNDELAELDPLARLLFIGLWNIADKLGRLEFKPKKIQAMIFPYGINSHENENQKSFEELISQLLTSGFIFLYDDDQYLQVRNWEKYQTPHHNEKPSQLPEPEEFPLLKPSKGLGSLNQVYRIKNKIINKNRNKDGENLEKAPVISKAPKITKEQVEAFVEAYNDICSANLPKCIKINSTRHRQIVNALIDEPRIEKWRELFLIVINTPFLVGDNDRGWRADIEFIAKNYHKIIEGKYINKKKNNNEDAVAEFINEY